MYFWLILTKKVILIILDYLQSSAAIRKSRAQRCVASSEARRNEGLKRDETRARSETKRGRKAPEPPKASPEKF